MRVKQTDAKNISLGKDDIQFVGAKDHKKALIATPPLKECEVGVVSPNRRNLSSSSKLAATPIQSPPKWPPSGKMSG